MSRNFSVGKVWEKWVWVALFFVLTVVGVRTFILFMYDNSINTTDSREWNQRWSLVNADVGVR